MESIVVTGGLGFIGSNFIHHIMNSRTDLKVTNVDAGLEGSNQASVRQFRRNPRYKFVRGNLANYAFTKRVLRKASLVVNFAAQTHVDRSIAGPVPFFESNARGAFNIFRSASENKIARIVHISTDEVYGSSETGSFDEKSVLNPSSPYSATKAAADLLAQAWNKTFELPVIVLRCTNNFGPRQHPEKFIPKIIIRAIQGQEIPVYGSGQQVRDWTYVMDFCTAIDSATEKGSIGEVYNISSGNEFTNKDVAEKVLRRIGNSEAKLTQVEDRPGHDFRYSLNSTKAQTKLGWKPTHLFDKALDLTIEWYRQNQTWWRPLATKKALSPTPWK